MPRLRIIIGLLGYLLSQIAYADNFLSVADLHFNPFATCDIVAVKPCPLIKKLTAAPANTWEKIFAAETNKEINGVGHDTNFTLLQKTLAALKKINVTEQPQFAVVLGDFLAHHYRLQYVWYSKDHNIADYQRFVKKTLEFLSLEMRAALPNLEIYSVVGNNDTYTGDYNVVPHGGFLHDTAVTWATLFKDKNNLKNFTNTFPIGGYYAVNVPHSKNKLIVLNTVLFSTASKSASANMAAKTELSWLRTQLAEAAKQQQKVILAYHIPMGVNVYSLLKNLLKGINEFWQTDYSQTFKQTLQDFAGTVTVMLPAHIHTDGSQIIKLNNGMEIPVVFNQAVSPIFGNNPAFKIYNYNPKNLQLAYYDLYIYPLSGQEDQRVWLKKYRKFVETTTFYPPMLFLNKLSTPVFPSMSHQDE